LRNIQDLPQTLERIVHDLDFPQLYKSYEWVDDTWENGFPDLFRLEKEISAAAKQNSLRREHLLKIAKWGKLPNIGRIACPDPIKITLYQNDLPAPWLVTDPQKTVSLLQDQIDGFGPTYVSKLLHFAVPQICGALDTRLVRVFGNKAQKYPLLDLSALEVAGRWAIPATQPGWPGEYKIWVKILEVFADYLNQNQIPCPHPENYVKAVMRLPGVWLPADVETALFAYASQELERMKI
jgi:hypothetical protein